jgi:hypothetical protein
MMHKRSVTASTSCRGCFAKIDSTENLLLNPVFVTLKTLSKLMSGQKYLMNIMSNANIHVIN